MVTPSLYTHYGVRIRFSVYELGGSSHCSRATRRIYASHSITVWDFIGVTSSQPHLSMANGSEKRM